MKAYVHHIYYDEKYHECQEDIGPFRDEQEAITFLKESSKFEHDERYGWGSTKYYPSRVSICDIADLLSDPKENM